MAFNGSGTFSRPVADYVFDSIISETDMNTEMDGIATGLTNCITKDGQTDTTAKINFASGIGTDTISEKTTATGVTIDGVLLKDSAVNVDTIAEKTAAAGVTIDGVLLKDRNVVLADSSDSTKKATFSMASITASNTRTLTVPDKDGTIATTADLAGSASDTAAGKIEIAIQSEMETGTDATRAVTPGRQHFHPSAAKGWVEFNGTGTLAIDDSYNVSSVTDNGTGDYTVNWATDFSAAAYAYSIASKAVSAGFVCLYSVTSKAAGTLRFQTIAWSGSTSNSAAAADASNVSVIAFGDQA